MIRDCRTFFDKEKINRKVINIMLRKGKKAVVSWFCVRAVVGVAFGFWR